MKKEVSANEKFNLVQKEIKLGLSLLDMKENEKEIEKLRKQISDRFEELAKAYLTMVVIYNRNKADKKKMDSNDRELLKAQTEILWKSLGDTRKTKEEEAFKSFDEFADYCMNLSKTDRPLFDKICREIQSQLI